MKVFVAVFGCLACSSFAQVQAQVAGKPVTGKVVNLSRQQAETLGTSLWDSCFAGLKQELAGVWADSVLRAGGRQLRLKYKIAGEMPADGRSLFISMHGGGNTTEKLNDQQWNNQIRLYNPPEGVYVAPRAPTNTWNLWHEPHIDTLFDRLIQAAVALQGVNPDKVYLMGYSAGGDGVYQLAPRMADRWAAAAMMAGHPNETSPAGLRNIGFTLHMGALDSAYNRNEIARRWGVVLDSLSKADPGGYKHLVAIHEGRAHWMNREDTVAVPWMMTFRRDPLPAKVVWKQDDVLHDSFYWLAVPAGSAKAGAEIIASYKNNVIEISRNESDTLIVRLNDRMLNLDKPVSVVSGGKKIFKGKVPRRASVIYNTVNGRKDPRLIFCSELIIVNGKVVDV